ncbi:hypothetical protein CDL15_Pgr001991 [Punica granatum]|uniref:Uncharacterized protein n=1 Tax=Punica granatum TaxID=22663 RepID=A0A218XBU6_PUNGR|nr:hypothetical protein CDL15_Pgr001991 [Punica granatum]
MKNKITAIAAKVKFLKSRSRRWVEDGVAPGSTTTARGITTAMSLQNREFATESTEKGARLVNEEADGVHEFGGGLNLHGHGPNAAPQAPGLLQLNATRGDDRTPLELSRSLRAEDGARRLRRNGEQWKAERASENDGGRMHEVEIKTRVEEEGKLKTMRWLDPGPAREREWTKGRKPRNLQRRRSGNSRRCSGLELGFQVERAETKEVGKIDLISCEGQEVEDIVMRRYRCSDGVTMSCSPTGAGPMVVVGTKATSLPSLLPPRSSFLILHGL